MSNAPSVTGRDFCSFSTLLHFTRGFFIFIFDHFIETCLTDSDKQLYTEVPSQLSEKIRVALPVQSLVLDPLRRYGQHPMWPVKQEAWRWKLNNTNSWHMKEHYIQVSNSTIWWNDPINNILTKLLVISTEAKWAKQSKKLKTIGRSLLM